MLAVCALVQKSAGAEHVISVTLISPYRRGGDRVL